MTHICDSLFGIFVENWVCPSTLDQCLRIHFQGFGNKEQNLVTRKTRVCVVGKECPYLQGCIFSFQYTMGDNNYLYSLPLVFSTWFISGDQYFRYAKIGQL